MISIIIPAFNEEKAIGECLSSLLQQTYKDLEVIVVDDGSTDGTKSIVREFVKVRLLTQDHLGAGAARNLGAKESKGDVLVFVDADMTFDKKFVEQLTKPIRAGRTIGTFSKNEMVENKNNVWSKCWNINKGLPTNRMHKKNYPDKQKVFRAILKKEFKKAGGFDLIGYLDDYTLSEKLRVEAIAVEGAFFYHKNPGTLKEVYQQARWVGKSEHKRRKIKDEKVMRLISIVRYLPPFTLINGLRKAMFYKLPRFLIFKVVYDVAIEISLLKSFINEQKYK